ncbi:MAG: hypothetical protein AAB699_00260 [Patescibacteria group bacterium]
MSRRTKIIIWLVAAALLAALAVWLYFYFRKAEPRLPDTGAFPAPTEGIPLGEEEPTVLPEGAGAPGAFRPILRQLSLVPIAGAVIGGKGAETRVRYIERANGNVIEIPASGGEEKRLTNTTIPKVHEALWNKTGNGVILRYLKEDGETIETFSARIKAGTGGTEGELAGTFLPAGITALALSPSADELFYLREERGELVGIRASFTGANKTELWRSPLREWLPLWTAEETLALVSKPSALSPGALLSLNRSGEQERVLLSGIAGLTALPEKTVEKVLASRSSENGVELFLFVPKTRGENALGVATLPEKCVWRTSGEALLCGVPKSIPGGSYPDSWYQGITSFADAVYEVGTRGGSRTALISEISEETGAPIDLTHPALSSDERFLVFRNKNDQTLWSLQLTE